MQLSGQNLSYHRADKLVFENLSFQISQGQVLQLHGPNGAGKTSLIRICARLAQAQSGVISDPMKIQNPCHYIGHKNALHPMLSVMENLRFVARLISPDAIKKNLLEQKLEQALAFWHLTNLRDQPVASLSAGQARAVSLSRLNLAHRNLWLLDEPTVALDLKRVAILKNMMTQHLEKGGLMILTDHHIGFDSALTLNMEHI